MSDLDLISRQQAIDAINEAFKYVFAWDVTSPLGEKVLKNVPSVAPAPEKCYNKNQDYAECDQFVCSRCGIELQDWCRVERDEDGDITYHEYEFRFCPNCGAKL